MMHFLQKSKDDNERKRADCEKPTESHGKIIAPTVSPVIYIHCSEGAQTARNDGSHERNCSSYDKSEAVGYAAIPLGEFNQRVHRPQ